MNNKDDTIQIIESYLNILLKTLPNDEYIMLIENTPILNEYDNLMSEFKEDNLSETYIRWLVKNFGDDFYEIYYGKIGHPKSFNFVFKKIIYNCNKFFKHAEQMKIYCKNKYEK